MPQKKVKKTKKKALKPLKRVKVPAKLVKYLDAAGVKHDILEHRTVYTAIDAAATLKKKINEIAKSLLVKADKDYFLVLLPGDHNLDFDKLKKIIGKTRGKDVKVIKIPGEKIVEKIIKAKAMSLTAFGKLHKVEVVLEKKLEKVKKAVLASGSPNYSIEMSIKDFIRLEEAVLGVFGKKKKIKKVKTMKPARKAKSPAKSKKKQVRKK